MSPGCAVFPMTTSSGTPWTKKEFMPNSCRAFPLWVLEPIRCEYDMNIFSLSSCVEGRGGSSVSGGIIASLRSSFVFGNRDGCFVMLLCVETYLYFFLYAL